MKIHLSKLSSPFSRMNDEVQKRLIVTGLILCLLCLGTFWGACKRNRNLEIVSRTAVSGSLNNAAFKGTITATINVGHGGHSSCAYEQLPPTFSPGTIGTHA